MITHFECMILRWQTVFLGPRSLQKNARKVQKVDYDWVIWEGLKRELKMLLGGKERWLSCHAFLWIVMEGTDIWGWAQVLIGKIFIFHWVAWYLHCLLLKAKGNNYLQLKHYFSTLQRLYSCLKPDPVVQREIEEKQGLDHRVELVKV